MAWIIPVKARPNNPGNSLNIRSNEAEHAAPILRTSQGETPGPRLHHCILVATNRAASGPLEPVNYRCLEHAYASRPLSVGFGIAHVKLFDHGEKTRTLFYEQGINSILS